MDADARADPRARRLPQPHLPGHRPRAHRRWARPSRRWASSDRARRPPPAGASSAPTVDFHALAPEIVLTGAIVRRAAGRPRSRPTGSRGIVPAARRHRAARRARAGAHPGRSTAPTGRCSAAPTWSTTSRWCSRRCSCWRLRRRAAVHELHRRGRLRGGRVLLPAAVVAARHDGDGVGSRDLVTIFVALELLSIPAYMLAGWRKRDLHGNEAGVKYYLMGVFASAVMLYGMSLLFGVAGSTLLTDIGAAIARRRLHADRHARHRVRGHRLRLQGVGRAVPHLGARHLRGRAHADHRVPRRCSKAAGFVALLQLDPRRLPRPRPTWSSR